MTPQKTDTPRQGLGWLPYLVLAFVLFSLFFKTAPLPELFYQLDNDSAMRLVTVRDLLGGQPWFDMTQSRLGLEGGFEMHWSRLVDAPIAALIVLFDLVLDRSAAEYAAIWLWPVLMLGAVMALAMKTGQSLGGRLAGAFAGALVLLMLWRGSRFAPGGIDHHNVQIALLMLTLWGIVARHASARLAGLGGAAMATSLAVGVETVPLLALCTLGLAGFWLARGAEARAPTLWFAGGSVGALALLFPLTAPASAWRGGFCDALSVDLALPAALGCGAMAVAAALVSGKGPWIRAAVLGGLFAMVGAFTLVAMPSCLSNPLDSLDPFLAEHWLSHVQEAKGLANVLAGDVHRVMLGYFLLGAAGVIAALALAWQHKSGDWLLMAVLVAAALAICTYQIRGTSVLCALVAPVIGSVIARFYLAWRSGGSARAGVATLSCFLLAIPATWGALIDGATAVGTQIAGSAEAAPAGDTAEEAAQACYTEQALATLAALPRGAVSATSNLGAQMMLHTPHRYLSAPYHRNQAGMRLQLDIALAPTPSEAESLLRGNGIDYVVICSKDRELEILAGEGLSGFGHDLLTGTVPDFLEPIALNDDTSALLAFRLR